MTTNEMIQAMRNMTVEQRMELLRRQRPEAVQIKAPAVSFGNGIPKGGWTESDKVAK